jgi:hypothetical protein
MSDNRCMPRRKAQRVYAHWGDVSGRFPSNAASHDEITSSSDDLAVSTPPVLYAFLIFA